LGCVVLAAWVVVAVRDSEAVVDVVVVRLRDVADGIGRGLLLDDGGLALVAVVVLVAVVIAGMLVVVLEEAVDGDVPLLPQAATASASMAAVVATTLPC
jgi:hypothetical protein